MPRNPKAAKCSHRGGHTSDTCQEGTKPPTKRKPRRALLFYGLILSAHCPTCGKSVRIERAPNAMLGALVMAAAVAHRTRCVPWRSK